MCLSTCLHVMSEAILHRGEWHADLERGVRLVLIAPVRHIRKFCSDTGISSSACAMKISSIAKVTALCVVMLSVAGCDPDRFAAGMESLGNWSRQQHNNYIQRHNSMTKPYYGPSNPSYPAATPSSAPPPPNCMSGRPVYRDVGSISRNYQGLRISLSGLGERVSIF